MGLFSKVFGQKDDRGGETYRKLRQQLLMLRPDDLQLPAASPERIFGIVMETGMDANVATFACLADGTVSLYLSNGAGVIGAGQHESVRSAAAELLGLTNEYAADYIAACAPGVRRKLPTGGRVHFYLLTYGGLYNADCDEQALAAHQDPFAHLYANCHTVMSEVRKITPNG